MRTRMQLECSDAGSFQGVCSDRCPLSAAAFGEEARRRQAACGSNGDAGGEERGEDQRQKERLGSHRQAQSARSDSGKHPEGSRRGAQGNSGCDRASVWITRVALAPSPGSLESWRCIDSIQCSRPAPVGRRSRWTRIAPARDTTVPRGPSAGEERGNAGETQGEEAQHSDEGPSEQTALLNTNSSQASTSHQGGQDTHVAKCPPG